MQENISPKQVFDEEKVLPSFQHSTVARYVFTPQRHHLPFAHSSCVLLVSYFPASHNIYHKYCGLPCWSFLVFCDNFESWRWAKSAKRYKKSAIFAPLPVTTEKLKPLLRTCSLMRKKFCKVPILVQSRGIPLLLSGILFRIALCEDDQTYKFGQQGQCLLEAITLKKWAMGQR